MSTNIHVRATREIIVVKTGVSEIQSQTCSMIWQTPTVVTKAIMACEDKKQAYIEWVEAKSKDETQLVYEENDIFHERAPIGVEVVNYGKIHAEEFKAWCDIMESKGYVVEFEAY